MRKNLPVTQANFDFPADRTLISITDTKGRITYCNADFIAVSGYKEDELLGQPHNLLRHPDMPAEAFRDFWDTIQKGLLWSAVIKNRRKNGDHYWVRANATPMRDGERIVGFLSVRSRPSNEEIREAEQLYARMSAHAEAGKKVYSFRHGELMRVDALGRLAGALRLRPRGQYAAWMALAAAGPVVVANTGSPPRGVWLAGVVSACVAGYGLAGVTLRPLKNVIRVSRQLASGDLSQFFAVQGNGVARSLLLPMIQVGLSTRTVMGDVRDDLRRLQTAAQEIAHSSNDLSARTEAQAASLEQSAAAMDEINSTVQNTSQLASCGVHMAHETTANAQRSQEAIRSVADTMQEITQSSKRIGDIIQVIESVAFQTNILALNAAVEAARAGEQGRGFAVVASEVRSLAHRTSGLAKEINDIIRESQQRVATGGQRTAQAGQRMEEAMQSVQKVAQMLQQIDQAAREQAQGVVQISEAVQHIDGITQQNAALVEQLAGAAQLMDAEARQARHNIQVFRLGRGDRTHAETDAVELRRRSRERADAEPLALEYDA